MANELNVAVSISASNATTLINDAVAYQVAQNMAGKYKEESVQTFTATPIAFRIGSITNVGYVVIKNTAASYNLLVSNGAGGAPVISIPPGGACLFSSATNTLFGAASAGTVDAVISVYEA